MPPRVNEENLSARANLNVVEVKSTAIDNDVKKVKNGEDENDKDVVIIAEVVGNQKKKTGGGGNHKVTDYFPVRRSIRRTKRTVQEERLNTLVECVLNECEDGLQVVACVGKGRGVVTTREFARGEFVVEYAGELIDSAEAKRREAIYSRDSTTGCYMYYFRHLSQLLCVDATAESGRLGRLVNHSRNGNLSTKVVMVKNRPRLVLIAKVNIPSNTELTYDYGDRSRHSLKHHPWLAS